MLHRLPRRGFSRLLAHLTFAAVLAAPAAVALIWIFWDGLAPYVNDAARFYDAAALGTGARIAGFSLLMLGALLQVYGLLGVRRTFLEAAQDRALSTASVEGFRRFAWICLLMPVYGVLQRTGLIALLSASDPAQPGALSIQIGAPELGAIFMGLLLVFVAHVFAEAKEAKDENDAFL